jgi:hypothetical protein
MTDSLKIKHITPPEKSGWDIIIALEMELQYFMEAILSTTSILPITLLLR